MARTPGPWAYDPAINRIFSTVTNECVAAPHVPGNPAADAAWPDDARVLAAAPELLAIAKNLRKRFRAALIVGGSDPEFADAALAEADAVIGKAEARS